LGSERTVTNSGQSVTATLTLSAFGQTVASSGSSTSAHQFGATSGYRTEGDAGLTLVGCRFYDAQVERFLSRDTDLNEAPYTYCDPVNVTNPSGHTGIVSGTGGAGVTTGVTFLAAVAIEINSGGAATPIVLAVIVLAVIVLAVVSGSLGGTASGASTAAVDGTKSRPGP